MTEDRKPIAKQGSHDGLCGVYCLINAVQNNDAIDGFEDDDLLRYFLEAAYRLNMLLPSKLSHGYEQHELADIFNEFCRSLRMSYRAHMLAEVQAAFPNLSRNVLAKRIFEEGGQLIIHTIDHEHWFLAYSFDFENKRFLVEDSDARFEKDSIAPSRVQDVGVVILPSESALFG